MRNSQRPRILEAGLRVAAESEGAAITVEAVAAAAGVTKPGLMYHFPTRGALMVALVDYAADQVKTRVFELLGSNSPSVADRYRAYIQVAAEGRNMKAEWTLFCLSAYRPELQAAWARQLDSCLVLPKDLSRLTRSRYATARLAADGLWAAEASGVLAPSFEDRDAIVEQMLDLIDDKEMT